MTERPWVVPVGGFLGAGKTTLILAAAKLLESDGVRTAVILNDQGEDLVDTAMARGSGLDASEVSGGCFCCNFSDFYEAMEAARLRAAKVIFAEPVGSCTDLSATILQPLKREYAALYKLAPLTVVVDPVRASEVAEDPDLEFLFRHQLAEADLVCFSKADLGFAIPPMEHAPIRRVSARTGEGVAAWITEVLSGDHVSGSRVLEIDYERYARAEAALAWLNWRATIEVRQAVSPLMMLGPIMDALQEELTRARLRIVHLKMIDVCESGWVKAAVTRNEDEPSAEGALDASPARRHDLLVNLRAAGDPVCMRTVVERVITNVPGVRTGEVLQCFTPSPPVPEREIRSVAPVLAS